METVFDEAPDRFLVGKRKINVQLEAPPDGRIKEVGMVGRGKEHSR